MAEIQATEITSLDDFQLLVSDQDILQVNGFFCLFEGVQQGQPVVLRRVDSKTASEMFLNPDRISFRNGKISAAGESAYISKRYSLYGEQTYQKTEVGWTDRNYWVETEEKLKKLERMGL
jgi:hypothetical protein